MSGFHRPMYDAYKFFLALTFFEAFEMTVYVKLWSMLLQRCFDGSKLLVRSLCLFHITSAKHLV